MRSANAQPAHARRSVKQELVVAQRMEALQIEHWCALLSHRPTLPTLRTTLVRHLSIPPELDAWIAESAERASVDPLHLLPLAFAIHTRDTTRDALAAVDSAVHAELVGDEHAQAQVTMLTEARVAHRHAKHQLVLSNLGLVRSLAKRYVGATTPLSELVQEGSIALLRAAELFDHRRGLRFSTYAVWWIRNAFHRCISEHASTVRAPLDALRTAYKVNRFVWRTYGRTGQTPSSQEVADHLGESGEPLEPAQRAGATRMFSLDRQLDGDDSTTFMDQLVDRTPSIESQVGDALMRERLEHGLNNLPELESRILRRRYGFGDGVETPLSVIARDFDLSYERALQLSRQALRRLRHQLERGGIGKAN